MMQVQVFQEVRKRKEAKEAVIAEKQKYLDDIQAHLDAIREASAPLTKHLQLPPRDSTHQQHLQAAAAVLPLPLYIVYRQLKAIATVYGDPVEVSIAGQLCVMCRFLGSSHLITTSALPRGRG